MINDGFLPPESLVQKYKGLMITIDGPDNTGKTEFILSAPGPTAIVAVDRQIEGTLDNPKPPTARRTGEFGIKIIKVPMDTAGTKAEFADYWILVRDSFYAALRNKEVRTVGFDGDSDSYELHKLALYGKLKQIPQMQYGDIKAERRAFYAKAQDSGKIIIATNKIKDKYVTVLDAAGNPVLNDYGKPIQKVEGSKTQGFPDKEYLWKIQLKSMFKPASINPVTKREVPMQWGMEIVRCKIDRGLEGMKIWGEDCNFQGLVSLVYPNITMKEWGYPE